MSIKVGLIDPSLMDNQGRHSPNTGDGIIQRAISREIRLIFGDSVQLERVSSHTAPGRADIRRLEGCDLLVVGGSNLLWFRPFPPASWRFGWRGLLGYRNLVLMGVGWGGYAFAPNRYGRMMSGLMLSGALPHSVRDGYTLRMMRDGFGFQNVLNTACPTMWTLTDAHLGQVPTVQGRTCLFTVTDYAKDPLRDGQMITVLKDLYGGRLLFWPQGPGDLAYCRSLGYEGEVFAHGLERLMKEVLGQPGMDYVGTRLHCGILCLEHGMRSLVVSVDNRATEIGFDTGLPVLERSAMEDLRARLAGEIRFDSRIPWAGIESWRSSVRAACGITHV